MFVDEEDLPGLRHLIVVLENGNQRDPKFLRGVNLKAFDLLLLKVDVHKLARLFLLLFFAHCFNFDDFRTDDLQSFAGEIVEFWIIAIDGHLQIFGILAILLIKLVL